MCHISINFILMKCQSKDQVKSGHRTKIMYVSCDTCFMEHCRGRIRWWHPLSVLNQNSSGSGNIRLDFKIQNFLSKHACLFHFCLTHWKKDLFWGTTFGSSYIAFKRCYQLYPFLSRPLHSEKWWHWFDICYFYYHTFYTQDEHFVELFSVCLFWCFLFVTVLFQNCTC